MDGQPLMLAPVERARTRTVANTHRIANPCVYPKFAAMLPEADSVLGNHGEASGAE